jgi:serine phosphatase RsbU (regulator of sigma subunit)
VFGQSELELMNSFAIQASISIENAFLVGNMVEQERLKQELELARKIQTALLPAEPGILGYEVSAIMEPADEVGGDYYDVINAGGMNWVVIGDVSGHGLPSGLVMMMVQTAVNVCLKQNASVTPSDLLTSVNHTISSNIKQLGESKYMTITVFALYPNGILGYAGMHQDIFIYRAATKQVEVIKTNGMWLGIMDDVADMMIDEELKLDRGDTLLLYTDGVTEATVKGKSKVKTSFEDSMYGDDRLRDVLARFGDKSTREIQMEILKELENYHKPDDVTMVVLKRVK